MAIAAALGLGSGMDIGGIVQQLVEADGRPALNSIKRKEDAANSEISAFGRLKGALSDFRSATGKLKELGVFSQHTATSGNEDKLTASASLGAAAGSYTLEITQLAEANKLISGGYTGYTDVIGSGTLTLDVGGSSFSVTLDATNNTLQGVRDAINTASDNSGVNASIINVDDGGGGTVSKMVFTAKETGSANQITVSSGDAGLSDLAFDPSAPLANLNMVEQNAALDAKIIVDGQLATRSSNSIDDVIQGVTLDLKIAEVGVEFNLDVALDETSIKEVTDGFVSAYNGLMGIVKDLGKYDSEGDSGALIGNSILRSVQSQMRQAVGEPVGSITSEFNSLAMIGISIDRDGIMALNGSEYSAALKSNANAVSNVFSSSDGVAERLDTQLDNYLQTGGSLDVKTKSLNNQLSRFSDDRDKVQLRLDNLERVMMKQFISMDVAVGQFQSTGAYLAQQLSNLQNF